jgi:hypothetical protein
MVPFKNILTYRRHEFVVIVWKDTRMPSIVFWSAAEFRQHTFKTFPRGNNNLGTIQSRGPSYGRLHLRAHQLQSKLYSSGEENCNSTVTIFYKQDYARHSIAR